MRLVRRKRLTPRVLPRKPSARRYVRKAWRQAKTGKPAL